MAASPTLVSARAGTADGAPAAASAGHLYEEYYDRIYGYCLYQLGSREEAEDAAQTTFLWAFRGLRRGVVPRAEASWLFTIAQNACRARHRSRGRRRQREVVSDPVLLADLSAAPVVETDALMGLEEALGRMPELQRRAILLREWRGLSYKEIAAELELSGSAVETLIFRARRSLAELLAGRPAPKRSRAYALDFGSLAAALKSFFGAGTVAKIVSGAAVVVAATTLAAGSSELSGGGKAPSPARPAALIPMTVGQPQAPAGPPVRAATHLGRTDGAKPKHQPLSAGPSLPAPPTRPDADLGKTVAQATDKLPVVPDVVQALPLATATQVVDSTLETVDGAVAPVTEALP